MVRSMQALWEGSKRGSEPIQVNRGMESTMGWATRVHVAIRRCLDWFMEY